MAGPKLLPVLNHPIADRSGLAGGPLTVNLDAAFGTEAIDDEVVRFTSQFNLGGAPIVLDMAMFSNRTPLTRQNFLKYVTDGDYLNSFIHRSVTNFVIQGGGFSIKNGNLDYVATDAPIANEFGVSNTIGTVSMAKSGGDPNSATSQWFVSLGANSDILDPQNGGFTVFGRVTRATMGNAQIFGNPADFPIYEFNSPFGELPLFYSYMDGVDHPLDFVIRFPTVAVALLPAGQAGEIATLIYSVVANSNPAVATASILPTGLLNLAPVAGQSGNTQITVRATDSVGNTVDDTFVLTVNLTDTYASWASRTSFPGGQSGNTQNPDNDVWSNLQEYAFLGSPTEVDGSNLQVIPGTSGANPARYLTLTFPVRKAVSDLTYAVEAADGLAGPWSEIWKSTDGLLHAQVVNAVNQADRTVVTIKDTAVIGSHSKRFLRTKVVQP